MTFFSSVVAENNGELLPFPHYSALAAEESLYTTAMAVYIGINGERNGEYSI